MAIIQIRNVSDDAHRRLKERAARRGQSLSEYLRGEIEELASYPTVAEINERLRSHEPVVGGTPAADLIRQEREERESRW